MPGVPCGWPAPLLLTPPPCLLVLASSLVCLCRRCTCVCMCVVLLPVFVLTVPMCVAVLPVPAGQAVSDPQGVPAAAWRPRAQPWCPDLPLHPEVHARLPAGPGQVDSIQVRAAGPLTTDRPSLSAWMRCSRQHLDCPHKQQVLLAGCCVLHGCFILTHRALYPTWRSGSQLAHCCCCCCCCCRGTGRDVAADERSAAAHSLMAAPVDDTLLLSYPDIYDVSQAEAAWGTEQGGKVGLLQQDRTMSRACMLLASICLVTVTKPR